MIQRCLPARRIENLEELARNLLKLFEMGARAMSNLVERSDGKLSPYSAASEITEAAETVADIAAIWMSNPAKLAEAQGALVRSYLDLWSNRCVAPFG